jgi:hypothetical protein
MERIERLNQQRPLIGDGELASNDGRRTSLTPGTLASMLSQEIVEGRGNGHPKGVWGKLFSFGKRGGKISVLFRQWFTFYFYKTIFSIESGKII